MARASFFLLLVGLLCCAAVVVAQGGGGGGGQVTYSSIPSSTQSLTVISSNAQSAFYSFVVPSWSSALTDVSALFIVAQGSPQLYCSLAQPQGGPGPQNNSFSLSGTGSYLLVSASVSALTTQLLASTGGTVYCAVRQGGSYNSRNASYTLAYSTTTRQVITWTNTFSATNLSLPLPALPPNSLQYITWSFPVNRTGTYLRGYFSFAATYATNAALTPTGVTSVAAPQPAILWSHYMFQSQNSIPSDPTLPSTFATTSSPLSFLQTAAGSCVVTFDRDQSYMWGSATTAYYVFAVFVPYAVPAGSAFSLTNVWNPATAQAASDYGGDNFAVTTITQASGVPSTSLTLGQAVGYSLSLPATAASAITVNLSVTSGNVDLYLVRTSILEGAVLSSQGAVNDSTGTGWGQGNNVGSNGYWIGNALPYFDFEAVNFGGNSITFTYTSAVQVAYYTIIAVAQYTGTAGTAQFSIAITSATPPITVINPAVGGLTDLQPDGSVTYYSYLYTGNFTSSTDISFLMVAASGSPIAYVSTSSPASATSNNGNVNVSGSLLLQSAASSGNPVSAISAASGSGTTIYVTVLAGVTTSQYSMSFSATQRILWSGLSSQSVSLAATPPNTMQYVQWSWPLQSGLNREYLSFAFTYTTNTATRNLGSSNYSQAVQVPTIAWNHVNFQDSASPPDDPVFTATLSPTSATPANSYVNGAFVTYDRDQSYDYTGIGIAWYIWAVYVPFSVPAGAVISLSNVATAASVSGATDSGGDDFNQTVISFNSQNNYAQYTGSVQAGGIVAYELDFPIATYAAGNFYLTLNSTSGNADIFILSTPVFEGASLFNTTSGVPIDYTPSTGSFGYGQGNNTSPFAFFNGALIGGYQYSSTTGLFDTVFFPWSASISSWWTLIVFGQQTSTFTLTLVLNSTTPNVVYTLPSAGATGLTQRPNSIVFYQWTITQSITALTDLAVVLLSASNQRPVTAYISTSTQFPSAVSNQYSISTSGCAQLVASTSYSQSNLAYQSYYTTGTVVYIAVQSGNAGGGGGGGNNQQNFTYSLLISATNRLYLSGLTNQSAVATTAIAAGSIQWVSWSLPLLTASYARGYYSFSFGVTTNTPLASLGASVTTQAAPTVFYNHINFDQSNYAPADPLLPAVVNAGNASATALNYRGGAVIVFDRDQSYPYPGYSTAWYVFGVLFPSAIAANTATFTLAMMPNNQSVSAATDAGGDDYPLATLTSGQTVSGTLVAGATVGYKIMLPPSSSSAQLVLSLSSSSGNADLFVENLMSFLGVTSSGFNYSTGATLGNENNENDDANAYYGGGANSFGGAVTWLDPFNTPYTATTFTYSSTLDPGVDNVTYAYSGTTQNTWLAVIVYAQRAATFTLSAQTSSVQFTDLSVVGSYSSSTGTDAASTLYFMYTPSTAVTAQTDLSIILLSVTGTPSAFISLSSANAPNASAPYSINGTGSLLLHSSTLSGNAVSIVPTGSTSTIYIAVTNAVTSFTISVSSTTRLNLTGIINSTTALSPALANSLQYISWSYPLETGAYLRNYMSYAVSYATNLSAASIPTGIGFNQPLIVMTHVLFDSTSDAPNSDPLLGYNSTMLSTSPTTTGAVVAFDRIQSYPYSGYTTGYVTFAIFTPYAVASPYFSLSSMTTAAQIAAASDCGGNDFITVALTLTGGAAASTGSLTIGQVQGYQLTLPPATSGSVTVTLTSTTGQAYLYAVPTQAFTGASAINPYSGAPVDTGCTGYGQGASWGSNAYWTGSSTSPIFEWPYQSASDTATNVISFSYSSTGSNAFYTIIVFTPRTAGNTTTFTLSISGPNAPVLAPSSSSSSSPSPSPSSSPSVSLSSSSSSISPSSSSSSVSPSSSSSSRSPSSSSSSIPPSSSSTPPSSSSSGVSPTSAPTSAVTSSAPASATSSSPTVSSSSSSTVTIGSSSGSSSSSSTGAGAALTPGSSSSSSSLSGGAIAGIVIGCVVGALIIVCVLWAMCVMNRNKKPKETREDGAASGAGGYERSEESSTKPADEVEMAEAETDNAVV